MLESSNSVFRPVSRKTKNLRRTEEGSATTKFVLVMIVLFLVGYGGYNYMTVWYQCSHFKDKMTEIITQAYALPNQNLSVPETIRQKIRAVGDYDSVPADAVIKVDRQKNGMQAQVTFMREVSILPFNMYKYKYQFNHTAAPPSMFEIK